MDRAKKRSLNHKQTIWLVGGGTGGHIIPLIAMAEVLRRDRSITLAYVGDKHGQEAALARKAGIRFLAIPYGKLRRYMTIESFFLNIRDVVRITRGIMVSYGLIRRHKPSLIFSKGGPVALPMALAAWLTGTPLVTHESDAVMGYANRFMARFARVVLTGFPARVYPAGLAAKIISVGIPLRPEFCRPHRTAKKRRPMILITGGSQGSQAINAAIAIILPGLLKHASVMHITGAGDFEQFKQIKHALPHELADHYGVLDFTPDIASYMREATVIVTRSGATIFEIASLHKPMILIPLPTAANNHQVRNAEIFVQHNAAVMLLQDNLTPDLLYETIFSVIEDTRLQQELREGTKAFASCAAAKRVADILKQHMEPNTE